MNHQLYVKRREKGLFQKDVAKKIGIHPQTYFRKEKGLMEFTIREARLLAKILDCTIDELFGKEVI